MGGGMGGGEAAAVPDAPPPEQDVCCTPADEMLANMGLGPPPDGASCRPPVPPPPLASLAPPPGETSLRVAVLTTSDRAAAGVYADASGAEVQRCLREYAASGAGAGWRLELAASEVVPDDADAISEVLARWADGGVANLVLTTGGTGLSPRDVTPEATLAVVERTLPGLPELLLGEALRHEPLAALSRAAAGVRGKCLIVNLPGRPRAVTQNMGALMPLLAHAVRELED
mmetsp:Transcript_43772/g.140612  ORF Transcript_43772/g.140612 Transcript_43772/m.140612 type:complete len:230 (+) Transcript_43772:1-690(+)